MSDWKDAYIDWLMGDRKGPRPVQGATPRPAVTPPPFRRAVDPSRALVPQGPRALIPQGARGAMPAGSPWSLIPLGAMGGATAGATAAGTLLIPTSTADDAEVPEVEVVPSVVDQAKDASGVGPVERALPETTPQREKGYEPSAAVKGALKKLQGQTESEEIRVDKRIKEREQIKKGTPPASVDDLRILHREMMRKQIKESGDY